MNKNDDPINEIREIRHQISKEFEHNPKRYIDYLKKIKANYMEQTKLYVESPNKRIKPTQKPRAEL